MMCLTRILGFSELQGSWNTACTERRYSLRRAGADFLWIVRPLNLISPSVGSSIIRTILAVVLLPQPDSPTTPRVSPCRRPKEMPSTALSWPKILVTIIPLVTGKYFLRPATSRTISY